MGGFWGDTGAWFTEAVTVSGKSAGVVSGFFCGILGGGNWFLLASKVVAGSIVFSTVLFFQGFNFQNIPLPAIMKNTVNRITFRLFA
jgi:uncharacterized membrane protein YjjP (DUF1212 family)